MNLFILTFLLLLISSLLRRDREKRRADFVTAAGYFIFIWVGSWLHTLIARLRPATMDARFLSLDRALGFNTIRFADWFARHGWIMIFLLVVYLFLPVVIAIAWIVEQSILMRSAVVWGGVFCWCFYLLFPAVGPHYMDWATGAAQFAPRNCMPSMHVSWSLLLAINSRSWLKFPLWGYSAAIILATLALGEHYLIDLLGAVPYTVAIQWFACYRSGIAGAWAPALREKLSTPKRNRSFVA
jgi:PAP2 superfamily